MKNITLIVCALLIVVVTGLTTAYALVPNPTNAYKYRANRIFAQQGYSSSVGAQLTNGGTFGGRNQLDDRGEYSMAHAFNFSNESAPLEAKDVHARLRAFYDKATDKPITWVKPTSLISLGYYNNGDLNGVIRIVVSQASKTHVEVVTECEESLSLKKYVP